MGEVWVIFFIRVQVEGQGAGIILYILLFLVLLYFSVTSSVPLFR